MKKLFLIPLCLLVFLCSCTEESKNCDIFEFAERMNNISGEDTVITDELVVSGKNKIYWFPKENKNACVSFDINSETGNIEKCSVVFSDKKEDVKISHSVKSALFYNNGYMKAERYSTEKYLMIIYSDSRYSEENTAPTLKKEIKEKDLY